MVNGVTRKQVGDVTACYFLLLLTNCHTHSGSKEHRFLPSQSEVSSLTWWPWVTSVSAGWLPPGDPKRHPICMPFPASRGRCSPWLPTPPASLEPAMACCGLVTLHLSSSLPLLGCLWLKWPAWLTQGHLPGLKSADWQSLWGHYSVHLPCV